MGGERIAATGWRPPHEEAMTFLRSHLGTTNLVRHSLATEAILRALARRLGEDEELWGLTGLFHDLDLDLVGGDMARHARTTVDILKKMGFPDEGLAAILAHNGDVLGVPLRTPLDIALLAAETTTGLIVAAALVVPTRKLADVAAKSVLKRMKEQRFAAGVDRAKVMKCEALGIPLPEFIELSLEAMRGVAADIGL